MNSSTRNIALLHLVANALLLWLAYEWLDVGESTGLRLAWSAIDGVAILALVCWLYGATFYFFRSRDCKLNEAFRTALRHVAPLVVAAVVVLPLYGLLTQSPAQPAFKVASYLTLKLHKPVKPASILRTFQMVLWAIRWIVLPVALLPMASAIAARGWRGFGGLTLRANWRYWLAVPLLLLAGLWLPFAVLGWIPRVGSFTMEMVSFALRAVCAYLLFVGGLVGIVRLSAGRG
jgi:hypothetical protein